MIETVYKCINEVFVQPKRYARAPQRQLMPYLMGMLEFDDNVLWHCHCLVAVHLLLANKFDASRI